MPIAARLFTGGALSSLLIMGLFLVPFPTGWEVGTAIVALKLSDSPTALYTGDCKARSTETGEILVNLLSECSLGGNSWNIDVDHRYGSRPSLTITTQQPRHTDAGGDPTPHSQYADTRIVTRQRDTWQLDRHIFMFQFQVNTVADVKELYCSDIFGQFKNCVFEQETSYVPSSGNCYPDLVINDRRIGCGLNGQPFDGSSLILFNINPWQGAR